MADVQYVKNYNAEIIAQAIAGMGKDFAASFQNFKSMQVDEKKLKLEAMDKIQKFMSLEPDERKKFLRDPAFRRMMLEALDPHLFTKHNVKKEGPGPSEATLDAMGEPSELETARLGKVKGEQREAEAKASAEEEKNVRVRAFEQASADYRSGKNTNAADLIHAGLLAGFAGVLDHPVSALRPDLLVKQEAAKTPGSPEWMALEVPKKFESLMSKYPTSDPKVQQTLMQVARALSDPAVPMPQLPKSLAEISSDLEKRRADIESSNMKETQLQHDAEMYKYLVNNGVPQDKVPTFIRSMRETGKPPAGMLFPADKKQELEKVVMEQGKTETALKIDALRAKDLELEQMMDASRTAAAAGNKTQAAAIADKVWTRMKAKYPDLKEKPGFLDELLYGHALEQMGRRAGSLLTGAVRGAAAVTTDAAKGVRLTGNEYWQDKDPTMPQVYKDLTGLGIGAGKALGGSASMLNDAAGEAATNASKGIVSGVQTASDAIATGASSANDYLLGLAGIGSSAPGSGTPSNAPSTAGVKPAPADLLRIRDTHLEALKGLSQSPLSEEQKQQLRSIVLRFQDAGDDPDKIFTLLSQLNSGAGSGR